MQKDAAGPIEYVSTSDAGPPHGHYSQAVAHDGMIYVSGILGNASANGPAGRSMVEQAQYCLEQMGHILRAADSSLQQLLKLTVYVEGVDHWGDVNQVCETFFGEHRPARIVVPASRMRFDSSIEMDAIAVAGENLRARP